MDPTRKYSERLGVITGDQFQEAADRFDLGSVRAAEPAPGGLFGQNVYLTTTSGEYVLRGNPHGHVQLTKERRVARFIHERSSLPAPWPYQVSEDTEIFGWTFAVMPRLPGIAGTVLWDDIGEEDRIALAAATGDALAALHEATSDFAGPYDAQIDDFVEMDDYADWALHRLEHWRNACRAVNALSTDAELYIDDLVESCAPALSEPFVPVLVHHDFKPQNLNFEHFDDGFEATGVFDLFEAYLANGEEDIVRMLWTAPGPEARDAFLDAYVGNEPLDAGAPERLTIFAVSDWLVIWEYGKRHGIWFEDTTFMERIGPIVANARAAGERGRSRAAR